MYGGLNSWLIGSYGVALLGGVALLEKVCHLEVSFEVLNDHASQAQCLLALSAAC